MPKERNKADGYREKVPIKREKIDACIDSSEREVSRPKVKAYEGDTKAMNRMLALWLTQINIDPTKYFGFTSLVKVVLIALSHPA